MVGKIGVLALQGAFAKHVDVLERIGVSALEVRYPSQLSHCDGLILPGGESTTMTKQILEMGFAQPLKEFAQHAPLFGTCAGMILMAQAGILGLLDITVDRNAYGRQSDSFSCNLDLTFTSSPLRARKEITSEFELCETKPDRSERSLYPSEEHHSQIEKGEAEDRLGEVVASPNAEVISLRALKAIFIRAPRISSIDSSNVQILASYAGIAVCVRQGFHLASSFHPELTNDPIMHQYFIQLCMQEKQSAQRPSQTIPTKSFQTI